MWVARDNDGSLHLFEKKPERSNYSDYKFWYSNDKLEALEEQFKDLTWEDEPRQVFLVNHGKLLKNLEQEVIGIHHDYQCALNQPSDRLINKFKDLFTMFINSGDNISFRNYVLNHWNDEDINKDVSYE